MMKLKHQVITLVQDCLMLTPQHSYATLKQTFNTFRLSSFKICLNYISDFHENAHQRQEFEGVITQN